MSAVMNILSSPAVFATAIGLAFVTATAAGWMGAALLRLRGQLAEARQEAEGLAAHRDKVLAELTVTRARLTEARQAVSRAQSAVDDRDMRLRSVVRIERGFGESRCETANRVIVDALRSYPQ